eukprot:CAMPEP_0194397860 /NCGR_PEP_ID=MMETSP0174-20130528/125780_1 /TAXON_ID=216777 /ORGANISM="Proboscia alata, Strain PI-D3" /LENGTH=545 /DNA_ID=CAMNT_0039194087 /DNA_START=140 /DNA_END=1774 /DNA_ORIENTATION=-
MGKKGKKSKAAQKFKQKIASVNDNQNDETKAEKKNSTNTIDDEVPENGWAGEMKHAARALKNIRNERNITRLARAYCKLRMWEKLNKLVSAAVNEIPTSSLDCHKDLNAWHKEANDNISLFPNDMIDEKKLRQLNIDDSKVDHQSFNNLNVIQYAAYQGDLCLLEKAVSYGAAIDYPVLDHHAADSNERNDGETEAAPPGTTALLLACMVLALYSGRILRKELEKDKKLAQQLKGNLECAIQLVKLGADCGVVLRYDNFSHGGFVMEVMKSIGIDNNNAYQMAVKSEKIALTRAMKIFESIEDKIKLVHCRCGSRIPWKDCHGHTTLSSELYYHYADNGDKTASLSWKLSPMAKCFCNNNNKFKNYFSCCWQDESVHCRCGSRIPWKDCHGHTTLSSELYYRYTDNGDKKATLSWRLSPMAKCFCHNNKRFKNYFSCCWQDESRYQDDSDSTLVASRTTPIHEGNRETIMRMAERKLAGKKNYMTDPKLLPHLRDGSMPSMMENKAHMFLKMVQAIDPDGISVLRNWDPEVSFGCMERIKDPFMW